MRRRSGLPDRLTQHLQSTPVGVTPPTASDLIVLTSSQSGLSSIFRALVTAGQPLLMESPSYWGAILAAAQAGVRVVPVATGPSGPDPDELARAFEETGARVFDAQPNYANPTGAQWSSETARRILEVVQSNGAFLIEDDWAHDFGITSTPTPVAAHDDAGHVVYIRSLTKSVSPSIRILQAAALDIVTQPGWLTHLRGLRQQLRSRRDLLVDSLSEHAPLAYLESIPPGGLNLWLRLPDTTDLPLLVRECESENVLIASGTQWFPAEPSGPFIRLNYSGPNPGAFPEAARIIGRTLERTS